MIFFLLKWWLSRNLSFWYWQIRCHP